VILKIDLSTNSWFRIQYYILKSFLFSKKYLNAIKIILKIFNNPNYKNLSSNITEVFSTTLGYLHLLINSHFVEISVKIKNDLPEFK
jgi:hypothetical protein